MKSTTTVVSDNCIVTNYELEDYENGKTHIKPSIVLVLWAVALYVGYKIAKHYFQ